MRKKTISGFLCFASFDTHFSVYTVYTESVLYFHVRENFVKQVQK